jgi:hypothetical protein
MLLATILVFACARRLYGTAAGWFAAAAFSTVEGTQFLGALATFDAMALALLALATWIVIRTSNSMRAEPHGAIYFAAPVMALANATKYASTLYDVVIVAIAFLLVASTHGWRKALKVAGLLLGVTFAICAALLALGGPAYVAGISSTTLRRPAGTTPVGHVLHESVLWVGMLTLLAVVAAIRLTVRAVRNRTGKVVAALGIVLASAVLLAPLNEARIHTTTSLTKHVDFGAWFGAIVAGSLLTQFARVRARSGSPRRLKRAYGMLPYALCAAAASAALIPMYIAGKSQARAQFNTWVNARQFMPALKPLVLGTDGPILLDDAEVPNYYLGNDVLSTRWHDTFYLSYTPPGSKKPLVGLPAYSSAIRHHYFELIALDFGEQHRVDAAVVKTISSSHLYKFVTKAEISEA